MELYSLYSGSSGNCVLVKNRDTVIMVDAGLSGAKIEKMLLRAEIDPKKIKAIVITHEHDDHVAGAGILSRRYDIPIYANRGTHEGMKPKIGKVKEENLRLFYTGERFSLGDIEIVPFENSHDANEPVGFQFSDGREKIALATDMGMVTDTIKEHLTGCRGVFLEANHDIEMLKKGKYPFYLKERILGNRGHLSNVSAGELCRDLVESGTEHIALGHLSRENNTPLLAYNTVGGILNAFHIKPSDCTLEVASRDGLSVKMKV